MLEWLCVNAASVAVGLAVLAVVALAAWKVLKDKKHGKGSCSCGSGCGGCACSGICHGHAEGK